MNVIVPKKRKDGGTSFLKLVSYVSQREDKPSGKDVLTDEPKKPRSESRKASFDRLVDYIDRADTEHAPVRITETFSDGRQRVVVGDVPCETNAFSYETAAAEMNMVAAQNRRVQDPVYHFIISWPADEKPTNEQVFGSAQYALKKLGLEGHQYVTAIHNDTDNVHAHVAANRVNPMTYAAANMWNDVDTLQKAMRALELHYGFKQDNGPWQVNADKKLVRRGVIYQSAPQGAAKREIFSDRESLYHYAVEKVRVKLNETFKKRDATWRSLHLMLHASGLGLRELNGGLVVYDFQRQDGPVVKASSVHPSLTKARLLARCGAFEGPPPFESDDPYEPWSYAVYDTYQPSFHVRDKGARDERRQERADARDGLIARYKEYRRTWDKPDLNVKGRYQEVAERFQHMKADVKRSYDDPLLRKLMYRVAEVERMKAMASLRIELREDRRMLADKGLLRPLSYRPWVEQQALKGDLAAVSQLRGLAYREKRKQKLSAADLDRTIVAGKADDTKYYQPRSHTSQLRRDGTIEYLRDGAVGVVDHGDRVEIKPQYQDYDSRANFHLAVDLVGRKSGERIEVKGTDGFVDRVLAAGCDFNHHDTGYVFNPTDPAQRARYAFIERDYRRHYKLDAPQEQRTVVQQAPVAEPKPTSWYPKP